MASANTKSGKMKIESFRSINDFLLDSKRYLPPTFNDLKRFNNRITSNLLYYQTNYFAISTVVFMLTLLFYLNRLFVGVIGISANVLTALFVLDGVPHPMVRELRSKYPFAAYGAVTINLIITYMTFSSQLVVLLVVLVPIAFWLLHASMRSRGIRNKVSNKMEQLGADVYTSTPMGFLITWLGLEMKSLED